MSEDPKSGNETPPPPSPDQAMPLAQPIPGAPVQAGEPIPGLSFSPGLRELPNSQVPGLGNGGMVSHVFGPGQAPVDPIAAGLDTQYNPLTRAENRMITQTGVIGAGPRPMTYAGKPGDIAQAGPADHRVVKAASDIEAGRAPGPNSTGGDAPEITKAAAEDKPALDEPAAAEQQPAAASASGHPPAPAGQPSGQRSPGAMTGTFSAAIEPPHPPEHHD